MTTVRRLGPGDEDVVTRLADRPPQTALLGDDSTIFLAAFDGDDPVGFVLAYELPRRHGDEAMLLVYEIGVDDAYQRRGVATSLLSALARIARERGIAEGFVLTDRDTPRRTRSTRRREANGATSSSGTSGTTADR
jgi:GNAT superfamily N-acetyltransferase